MWLQNLQKALRANNRSSLAKDETSGPFVATCSSVRKNDEKKKKKNLKMLWCCGPMHTSASVLCNSRDSFTKPLNYSSL